MNINKKLLALSVVLSAMSGCVIAKADTHTLSLGYSQGKVTDFKNLHGVTAKYHYQDGSLGFISSLTYMGGSKNFDINGYKENAQIKYYSLLVGPSYHVNEFVSLYGLAGVAQGKRKFPGADGDNISYKDKKSGFAYGVGVQISPAANWSIDLGYEGSTTKNIKINGFNIGLGYRL